MTKHLYTQNIRYAFDNAVGSNGASKERFDFWLAALALAIPRIKLNPQKEAEPLFSLPSHTDDLAEIEETASYISDNFNTLVVVGMGGSSLSGETLACIRNPGGIKLHFIDNIDPHSIDAIIESIEWRNTAFLVISKSGNTVESLAQMAVLLRQAKNRLADYAKHFFVITIKNGNPLHIIAKEHGMHISEHDPKLGGRFAVFSSVGLIPAAAIGLDIRSLRAGAQSVIDESFIKYESPFPAAESAALHLALIEKNVRINILMHYCDRLGGLANWYRQCWGESLGKCTKATTPVTARGATDQHSQLQLYLDGPKDKLFTLIMLESNNLGAPIDYDGKNDIRLDFLKGHTLGDLMAAEQRATVSSLVKNNCPVRSFIMNDLNEEVMGALLMHFTLEVVFTAQLLNVNAFDQPAVEQSKIFAMQYLSGESKHLLRAKG